MDREVDVIVTAYAKTPFMQNEGLRLFDRETVIVEVPFNQGTDKLADAAFRRTVSQLKDWKDGSVLRSLFRQRLRGMRPRTIAVIAFSAGTTFAKAVLGGADRDYVDTVIVLDGLHFPRDWRGAPIRQAVDPWVRYGELAAMDERMLVLAETDIVPHNQSIITSTSESAELVQSEIESACDPDAFWMQAPAYVDVGGSKAESYTNLGNFWRLEYGGGQAEDHVRVAHQASEWIWKSFLVPRWNAPITCRLPDAALSGLGAERAECISNRALVPESMYGTDVVRDYVLPGAIAAAVFGGAYLVGSQIARYV